MINFIQAGRPSSSGIFSPVIYAVAIALILLCPIVLKAQTEANLTKGLEIAFESGIHLDVQELIDPSYDEDNPKPAFIPDDFEPQKVLAGWSNRLKISYRLNAKWSLATRIGYTTFKRSYEKSNTDIYGIFEGKKYVERHYPLDFLIERRFVLGEEGGFLNVAIGPIFRFFDDSSYDYGITQDANGDYYVPGVFPTSRNFADMGVSYNLAYGQYVNDFLEVGGNLNVYTLFYGYGLESVIIAPYINLKF